MTLSPNIAPASSVWRGQQTVYGNPNIILEAHLPLQRLWLVR